MKYNLLTGEQVLKALSLHATPIHFGIESADLVAKELNKVLTKELNLILEERYKWNHNLTEICPNYP